MEDEKEDSFRKLIQKVATDKPGADFTHAVMKRVQAESELEFVKEAAMGTLLQAHVLTEKPPADFSRRVMHQVTVSHAKRMEPIISVRAWYLIAASLLAVVGICFLVLPSGTTQHTPSAMDRLLSGAYGTLDVLPISYPLTIFAVSVLMVTDYFLRHNTKRLLFFR